MKIKDHKHCIYCGGVNYNLSHRWHKDKLCEDCKQAYENLPGVNDIDSEEWP